jgi:two-component system cell cycle sensor histidine kinase/response regulator CckA
MKFPRFGLAGSTRPEAPQAVAGPAPDGVTVILMVEDEPAVRGLFAQALRRDGYYVLEASNGAEALKVTAQAGRLDLVITDVVMPIMRGPELAAQLRLQYPTLKFIFVSGYLVDEDLGPNSSMLQKPFVRGQLAQLVLDLAGPPAVQPAP